MKYWESGTWQIFTDSVRVVWIRQVSLNVTTYRNGVYACMQHLSSESNDSIDYLHVGTQMIIT